MSEHPANTMAGLLVAGGLMAYFKSGSAISLVASTSIAAIYVYSGYQIKKNNQIGYDLATLASVAVIGAMGPRAIKSFKPIPTTVSILGLASGAYYAKKSYEFRYGV
ncbi:TMEM14 protein-like protein [Smittium mucronatum]|uniref:TMEM14 protein-like protein n=1 Tax=Smittium mucronatum TaxID=133383 RepID=A0A1R0H8A1_9FUNG|nr:TMEM14 protein-like protein [Smittium mucronatum]